MNLWLIIALKHTTWAVVRLNFPALISKLLRLCVQLRWSIKNSYLMIAFVMTPLILLSRCPVIFVYWRKSIALTWINWRVKKIACGKSCVLSVLSDWLLVKRMCSLERYPSSFVLYSLNGRCAVFLFKCSFSSGNNENNKIYLYLKSKGGNFRIIKDSVQTANVVVSPNLWSYFLTDHILPCRPCGNVTFFHSNHLD